MATISKATVNISGVTFPPDDSEATFSGDIAATIGSCCTVDLYHASTITFQLAVPTGGTVEFGVTMDGSTWIPIIATRIDRDDHEHSRTTSKNSVWQAHVLGFSSFRACVTVGGSAAGYVDGKLGRSPTLVRTEPHSHSHHTFISGVTTGTVIKGSSGALNAVVVSSVSQNANIALYDAFASSGTLVWQSGAMGAQTQPYSVDFYNLHFDTALTLVTSGAAANVLVLYE
jgi:hypothetical protein